MGLPDDVANDVVDVAQFAAMLKGTRKPLVVSSPFGGASLYAMHEMAAACGEAGSFACLAMSSPPLMLDHVCCDKALACADLQVPLVLAGSVSVGSQGPASLAACVAVVNAEALAALVVHQLARPGAPFVFGAGTGVMNMGTVVDVYNAPGVFLANQAHLDLIHGVYDLPSWSYAGHSDSKLPDEQWSLELGIATVLGTLSRDPPPRRRLSGERAAERPRGRGARRRDRRLRPRPDDRGSGRRRGAGPGRDRGRRARR